MRNLIAKFSLALLLVSTQATADFLGLYVGGGVWNHDPSGNFRSVQTSSSDINMASDLGFSDESETYLWAAFDHPVPLLPNVRIEVTSLGHEGISAPVTFNGVSVSGATEVKLDSTDLILYYRLLDNWVNLDLGLNLRALDGKFSIGTETITVDETVPMLYLAAQFDLPLTGLSVGADYRIISYSGNSYDDIRLRVLYELGLVGFEAGLRSSTITLDDVDNVTSDIKFEGLMLGMFLHF